MVLGLLLIHPMAVNMESSYAGCNLMVMYIVHISLSNPTEARVGFDRDVAL
jgi:hypothetical protein